VQKRLAYLSKTRVLLEYDMPLNEIVLDFFDKLKSVSRGTPRSTTTWPVPGGSPLEARSPRERRAVDALSLICHRDKAEQKGAPSPRR